MCQLRREGRDWNISPTFNFLHGRPVSRNSIKMTTSEAASEADSAMSQVNTFFHIRFKSFFGKNRECIPILFFIQLKGHKNCIGQQVNTLRTSFKKGFPWKLQFCFPKVTWWTTPVSLLLWWWSAVFLCSSVATCRFERWQQWSFQRCLPNDKKFYKMCTYEPMILWWQKDGITPVVVDETVFSQLVTGCFFPGWGKWRRGVKQGAARIRRKKQVSCKKNSSRIRRRKKNTGELQATNPITSEKIKVGQIDWCVLNSKLK